MTSTMKVRAAYTELLDGYWHIAWQANIPHGPRDESVYVAPSASAARQAVKRFTAKWTRRYSVSATVDERWECCTAVGLIVCKAIDLDWNIQV